MSLSAISAILRRFGRTAVGRSARADGLARLQGRRIIIGVHAGGLGDHLAYSALPRLYKRAGAASVLVSQRTNHGEAFARNPETIELVWKPNPYVDGFTEEPANVGETGWPPYEFFSAAKRRHSPVDSVADVHGLTALLGPPDRLLPPKPDLFYRPRARPDFADKVVCDPWSISQGFAPDVQNSFIAFVADWHGIDIDKIVLLCSRQTGTPPDVLSRNTRHAVSDIFEYTDIIASARSFLVTESGGQSVAAAVRPSMTFVLTTTRAFNQRHFIWPTNTYYVTGQMTPGQAEWAVAPVSSRANSP